MSSEDGSRTGSSDLEDTLVAALGFEPTAGVAVDSSNVLVDDGTGDALDWSGSEGGSPTGNSDLEVHDSPSESDGADTGPDSPTAKADSTMTPPKGKGKGPRTFRNMKSGASVAPTARANGSGATGEESGGSLAEDAADVTVELETGTSDVDPADLVDGDSSGVKPVELDGSSSDDASSSNGFVPDGVVPDGAVSDGTTPDGVSDSGAVNDNDEGPPLGDLVDETGPIAAAGLLGALDPPPPSASGDATGPMAMSAGGGHAVAATVLTGPPPPPPLVEVDPSGGLAPTGEHVAVGEAVPVLDPPPPIVGDPTPALDANGFVREIVTTDGAVVRAPKTDLGARLPQLLDSTFLKRTRRVKARKVRRVVRHIDPWSILTFSVLFFLCLFAALLLASVLVWNAAVAAGTIENIESFIREIGDYQTYEIKGDVVFRAAMVIMGILTLAASVMVVLLVVVFNLISDLVGGIRITVIEEETVRVRRRQNQ